jgi:hypothetical protein
MQGCEPIRGTRCATERGRVEHAPMDEICSRSAGRVLKPASQSLVRRKSSSTRSPLLAFLGLSLENLESRAIGPDVLACALAGARGLGRPRAAIAIAHSLTRSLTRSLAHTHTLSLSVLHTLLCRFDQCPRIRRQFCVCRYRKRTTKQTSLGNQCRQRRTRTPQSTESSEEEDDAGCACTKRSTPPWPRRLLSSHHQPVSPTRGHTCRSSATRQT